MHFVVNYQADYGTEETFGYFNTATDAINWMKSDVEFNIENAKKNGVKLIAETINSGNTIKIPEYGTWMVTKVTPVGI